MTHATDVTSVANWVRTLAGPNHYNTSTMDAARIMLYSQTVHDQVTNDSYEYVWQVLAERSASNYTSHPNPPNRICGIISNIYRELLTELGYTQHRLVRPIGSFAASTETAPQYQDHIAVEVFDGSNWVYQDPDFGFKLIASANGAHKSSFALAACGDYDAIVPSNNWVSGWDINDNGGPLPMDLKNAGFFDIVQSKQGDPNNVLMVGKNAVRRDVTLNGVVRTLESVILETSTPATLYIPGWAA